MRIFFSVMQPKGFYWNHQIQRFILDVRFNISLRIPSLPGVNLFSHFPLTLILTSTLHHTLPQAWVNVEFVNRNWNSILGQQEEKKSNPSRYWSVTLTELGERGCASSATHNSLGSIEWDLKCTLNGCESNHVISLSQSRSTINFTHSRWMAHCREEWVTKAVIGWPTLACWMHPITSASLAPLETTVPWGDIRWGIDVEFPLWYCPPHPVDGRLSYLPDTPKKLSLFLYVFVNQKSLLLIDKSYLFKLRFLEFLRR